MMVITDPRRMLPDAFAPVWKPTEDGAKRAAHWWAVPHIPGFPRRLYPPEVRHDRDEGAYTKRLLAGIGRKAEDRPRQYWGSGTAGWRIAATDGSRALFEPGKAVKDTPKLPPSLRNWPQQAIELEPAFFLVLVRLRAAGASKKPLVRLRLHADAGASEARLLVMTADQEAGVVAHEALMVHGRHLGRVDVWFNTDYLLEALGMWPATLRIGGPLDPAWIELPTRRYCVMPFRQDQGVVYTAPSEAWPSMTPAKARVRAKAKAQAAVEIPLPAVHIDSEAIKIGAEVARYLKIHQRKPYVKEIEVQWMIDRSRAAWRAALIETASVEV